MITIVSEHYYNHEKKNYVFDFKGELDFDHDYYTNFKNKSGKEFPECFRIRSDKTNQKHYLSNSYFVGIDWIVPNHKAIYVQPKLNQGTIQTDYIGMLFSALKHPGVSQYTDELFEIKFDSPHIEIKQHQDLLTPLLIAQFLSIVQAIVRKGIKKSYYKVQKNLHSKVKGKVMTTQTINKNLSRNKILDTFCTYEEFGVNNPENQLLKKALTFITRYCSAFKTLRFNLYINPLLTYITPAFEEVSEAALTEIRNCGTNGFYNEYKDALRIANLILKRFGYNIQNTSSYENVKIPPFWIDMSKLFELYILGLLKDEFGTNILYGAKEAKANFGLPDYLLIKKGSEMIVDAKYKPIYNEPEDFQRQSNYDIDNIRQLAGYARDKKLFKKLCISPNKIVDCLIIYPLKEPGSQVRIDLNQKKEIGQFVSFYKLGISLPMIDNLDSHDLY